MPFFSLYLNIRGLRKGPGKFFMGVLKSRGFFVTKRVGNLETASLPVIPVSELLMSEWRRLAVKR